MSHIMSYLTPSEQVQLQQLSQFFYHTQARSFNSAFPVLTLKRRLHLLNQDYVLLFNFEDMSKHKYIVRNAVSLWNH